jgi:Tol biopolymer transport system component
MRPAISPDGGHVAYPAVRRIGSGGNSDTLSLGVFVYDRETGRTARIAGERALDAAGVSLSRGGRHVAFVSTARLTPADRNRVPDAYVLDRRTGRLALGSRGARGRQADRGVFNPVLSARGDRLAFESDATTLAPGAARRGYKVFVRDLRAGRTLLASVGADGRPVTDDATSAALSSGGRFVAFQVSPLNGPIGDIDGPIGDVLVRDLARGTTVAVSATPAGAPSGRSGFPALSGDGRFVAFTSSAALVEGDANGLMDVFVRGPLR